MLWKPECNLASTKVKTEVFLAMVTEWLGEQQRGWNPLLLSRIIQDGLELLMKSKRTCECEIPQSLHPSTGLQAYAQCWDLIKLWAPWASPGNSSTPVLILALFSLATDAIPTPEAQGCHTHFQGPTALSVFSLEDHKQTLKDHLIFR